MSRFPLMILFLTAGFLAPSCTPLADLSGSHSRAAFAKPKDDPALPNVLLIGDSISIYYTARVRQMLKGKADVFRIRDNGKSTDIGLENLDQWLGDEKWDVIHFNWGLWDIHRRYPDAAERRQCGTDNRMFSIPPEQYRQNLEKILVRLKRTDAELLWCTTTPVPEGEPDRRPGDEIAYNRIAGEVMARHGIATNDLHSHAMKKLPGIAVKEGDVHFTNGGYTHLAQKVTESITACLKK